MEEITDDDIKSILNKVRIVRPLIMDEIERGGRINQDTSGKIDCPICKTGKVSYSRAGSYNGHVSAQCSSAGCVYWIE
jgi:hypothetical protein